jgi:hypothetical protein
MLNLSLWTNIRTNVKSRVVLVRFEIHTAVAMKIIVLWNMTPCHLVSVRWRAGGAILHPSTANNVKCKFLCPCISKPTTGVTRSKAWTVFALSKAGIVGSNPTQGMDVCVRLFCLCVVLCVGRRSPTDLVQDYETEKKNGQGPTKGL